MNQLVSIIVTSFICAVFVVWSLKLAGIVEILGMRGGSWGTYLVNGSISANALIAVALSVAFIGVLGLRVVLTVPSATRFVVRSLGDSRWKVNFMKWATERRNATIASARWILDRLQELFKW